ncbi:MAG: lipoprotein [Halioglobus sp.]
MMKGTLLIPLLALLLSGCAGYELKNLVKSDIDLVTDEFIEETRAAVQELVVKLYKRNPSQLRKIPGMTVEGRLAQLRVNRYELNFAELGGRQDIDAMNLAFDPNYNGDRVFALAVGLGSMLRQAYQHKPEMFLTDRLDPDVLLTSARNVEVLLWKLKNTRWPNGRHYIVSHENNGVVDNLSFERLFGKIIILQEMMARIADDSGNRTVTGAVHAVGSVFLPLPI